jgi:hypothetical protein
VAFLATLSLDYLGGSRFYARAKKPAPVGPPRCDDSASAATARGGNAPNALFSPNVQPGGERPLPPPLHLRAAADRAVDLQATAASSLGTTRTVSSVRRGRTMARSG